MSENNLSANIEQIIENENQIKTLRKQTDQLKEYVDKETLSLLNELENNAEQLNEIVFAEKEFNDLSSILKELENIKEPFHRESKLHELCTVKYQYPEIKTIEYLKNRIKELKTINDSKQERYNYIRGNIINIITSNNIEQFPKIDNNRIEQLKYVAEKLLKITKPEKLDDIDVNLLDGFIAKIREKIYSDYYFFVRDDKTRPIYSKEQLHNQWVVARYNKLVFDIGVYIKPIIDYFNENQEASKSDGYRQFEILINRWKKCQYNEKKPEIFTIGFNDTDNKELGRLVYLQAYPQDKNGNGIADVKSVEELTDLRKRIAEFNGFTNKEMVGIIRNYIKRIKREHSNTIIKQKRNSMDVEYRLRETQPFNDRLDKMKKEYIQDDTSISSKNFYKLMKLLANEYIPIIYPHNNKELYSSFSNSPKNNDEELYSLFGEQSEEPIMSRDNEEDTVEKYNALASQINFYINLVNNYRLNLLQNLKTDLTNIRDNYTKVQNFSANAHKYLKQIANDLGEQIDEDKTYQFEVNIYNPFIYGNKMTDEKLEKIEKTLQHAKKCNELTSYEKKELYEYWRKGLIDRFFTYCQPKTYSNEYKDICSMYIEILKERMTQSYTLDENFFASDTSVSQLMEEMYQFEHQLREIAINNLENPEIFMNCLQNNDLEISKFKK